MKRDEREKGNLLDIGKEIFAKKAEQDPQAQKYGAAVGARHSRWGNNLVGWAEAPRG